MSGSRQTPDGSPLLRRFVGDDVHYESGRGTLVFPRVLAEVFQYRTVGHYDAVMVAQAWASFDQFSVTRPGRRHAFADFSAMTGYDTEARVAGADGFRARLDRWETFHVLLPTGIAAKLISMGLSAMALASGVKVRSYTDPARFAAERARYDAARR